MDSRAVVGAMFFVAAMVLGAFGGLAVVQPSVSNAAPSTGTRSESPMIGTSPDNMYTPEQARSLFGPNANPARENLAASATGANVDRHGGTPADVAADPLTSLFPVDAKTAQLRAASDDSAVFDSAIGTITVKGSNLPGTRGPGDPVDAGGPYTGVEGDTITVSLAVNDPKYILFQYDFDADGVIDAPDQAGAPDDGNWVTSTEVQYTYYDNYRGSIVVRAWDAVSRVVTIGANLPKNNVIALFTTFRNTGYKFIPTENLEVSELMHFKFQNQPLFVPFKLAIWEVQTQTIVGECVPDQLPNVWNVCPLPSTITLLQGNEYIMTGHKGQFGNPNWPNVLTADQIPSPKVINILGRYADNSVYGAFPGTFMSALQVPKLDFTWREVHPDALRTTASVDIDNVAPTPRDLTTNPSPAIEGPNQFYGYFTDPGFYDTWQFRYKFHDGQVTNWQSFRKFQSTGLPPLKIFMLHSWSFDQEDIKAGILKSCGSLCASPIDDWDFGPVGQNSLPDFDTLMQYDVIIVGSNYFYDRNLADPLGNMLADLMDRGKGVVGAAWIFGASETATLVSAAKGRWQSGPYSPLAIVPNIYSFSSFGKVYIREGHEITDGVAAMTSFYRENAVSVKAGAKRIADFADGIVLAATRELPNGARSAGLPWWPSPPAYGAASGDYYSVVANAILWAGHALERKPSPYRLDAFTKVFADDDPTTTTPFDLFPVTLEVRDDDDGVAKSIDTLASQSFNNPATCSWASSTIYTWPAGWVADPTGGWRCQIGSFAGGRRAPYIQWNYNDPLYGTGNGISDVIAGPFDYSAYATVRIDWYNNWNGAGGSGFTTCTPSPGHTPPWSDGYIDASTDGGATWSIRLKEYHHQNPATDVGMRTIETTAVAGYSSVMYRFRYVSCDDAWWFFDDLVIKGLGAEIYDGLGVLDGQVQINNVQPVLAGSFSSTLVSEADTVRFGPYDIVDPATDTPTEWFAVGTNFGDGTPTQWQFLGSFRRAKVLVINSLCLDANECAESEPLMTQLRSADVVARVDSFGIITADSSRMAIVPPESLLSDYDVIMFATLWAWSGGGAGLWRNGLVAIGDMMARYVESGRGGVVTLMRTYDCFFTNCALSNIYAWDLRGRYTDEDFGPFEKALLRSSLSSLGTIYDPGHEVMANVHTGEVDSSSGPFGLNEHGGDYRLTPGATLLADWKDGASAIGAKVLPNGMRTVHIGAIGSPVGVGAALLLRNAIAWAGGGFKLPVLSAFDHIYGDNGVYNLDLMIIDDDMGMVWDAAANAPVQVLFGQGTGIVHRQVTIAVDNTDPVIRTNSIEAFIAAQACVRVSGTGGNTVTARFYTDTSLSATVSVTREGGSPNPTTDKCGLLKLDVRTSHTYSATLTYSAPMGGSNPTWLVIMPWRDPVSPGHGTVSYKYDFAAPGTVTQPLPNLKRDLLDAGQGAKIDFAAVAVDRGSDDLAFFWIWGTVDGTPYQSPNPANAVYTIHVHHNDGTATTDGVLAGPQFLGFTDPYFDRTANSGRSPWGTTNFGVRDSAIHAFDMQQTMYYVVLFVLDDDNTRGYPSHFAPNDGVDMTYIFLNLG